MRFGAMDNHLVYKPNSYVIILLHTWHFSQRTNYFINKSCFWCYNTKFDNTIICYISFAQWGDTIFSMHMFMVQRTTLKLDQRDKIADALVNLLLAFLWCYTTVPPLAPKDCRYRCITSLWYISLLCCSYLYGMQLCWFLWDFYIVDIELDMYISKFSV